MNRSVFLRLLSLMLACVALVGCGNVPSGDAGSSSTTTTTQYKELISMPLSFRNTYNHHMVLQQNKSIPVAGYGTDGETVTVTLGNNTATATVENGTWAVELPAMNGGFTPYTLTAKTATEQVELTDILIGEVWIFTGQSNPAYQIDQIVNLDLRQAVIDHSRDEWVRSVTTCHCEAPNEYGDFTAPATWVKGTDDTMRQGAIGIAFAKCLRDALNVPVGVVTAAWGGSFITQWTGEGGSDFVYRHTAKCWTGLRYAALVWYQGESDQGASLNQNYARRFGELRERFFTDFIDGEMNMFVVQLPNHQTEDWAQRGWVKIRATQESFMDTYDRLTTVCTIDMGEKDNIHPDDKLSFAKRIAGSALNVHYGDKQYGGVAPRFKAVTATDSGWTVTFVAEAPLCLREGNTVDGLELETADGTRVQTTGRITGDNTMVVDAVDGVEATQILYLQNNYNPAVNLFDENGLPAFPFAATIE